MTHPQLSVRTSDQGAVSIVTVSGEVDLATAPSLRAALAAVVEHGASSVVVDLLDVTFMDSSGLGSLLAARDGLGSDQEIVLVVGEGVVERLLGATAIGSLFKIVDSVEAALP